jgi:hypothetical protein
MRAALIGALLAVLGVPVRAQQMPELAAARVAAQADSTGSAERRRIIIDIAGGAVVGAATSVVLIHAFYTVFRDFCESWMNEGGARCGRPNYVKWGLLGAASGAIAGATIAIRRGERARDARVRIAAVTQPEGIALQFVFR